MNRVLSGSYLEPENICYTDGQRHKPNALMPTSRKGEIMIENGKRYLVTSDNWFQAPDGERYCAAWGLCELQKMEDVFGFTPSRPSTNWFLKVGTEDNHIIIAGCQIHFAIRSENRPVSKHEGKYYIEKDTGIEWHEDRIYFTE